MALDLLADLAGRSGPQEVPGWVAEVLAAWRDWKAGHPPGRLVGRAAQNPRLILAFDRLDLVEAELQARAREAEERALRAAERRAARQR
ncbi:MAG: hypothetical protein FJX77_14300 [Armatimonadetes bacterium]|nr:hypothetical protein [Armatimonadota bacterium]